jgi:hypothetical protein
LTTEVLKCLLSGLANPTTKPQVAVQLTTDATVLEENYRLTPTVLGHRSVDLLMVATALAALAVTAMSSLIAILEAEVAAAGAPHTGLEGDPMAGAIAAAEARCRIEEIRRNKSTGENDGFLALSARLRILLLQEKFKPLGITKYDAKQDPI